MARYVRLNRRAFLSGLVAGSVGSIPIPGWAQSPRAPNNSVRVQIQPEVRLGRIPADFMGLGYEVSSVSERGLLAASNQAYVQLVRTLAPEGVIRIGGNTSDYATWSAYGPPVSSPKGTVVDRRGIADLGTFLRATGWRLIWGFNLGSGTVEQAVDEAAAVASSAGERLLAFEIGNEPDLFPGVHRPANYSYADYSAEYRRFKNAIRDKLPRAPFAGPDVIVHADWLEQFAAAEAADIQSLTYHYYAEGPPDNPASTIENLLKPNSFLPGLLGRLETASHSARVPYRICETNSCFGGGKPGVSDTMAAALWGLDFMFTLAQFNAAGVNMETGVNHLGFLSFYTPMAEDGARPLYYGMLAFSLASRGERVQLTWDTGGLTADTGGLTGDTGGLTANTGGLTANTGGLTADTGRLNLTAYAVRSDDGSIWLTLVNKEAIRGAHVRAMCPGIARAGALRLSAPSLSSKAGVTLGGSAVGSDGKWTPSAAEPIPVMGGEMEIDVPAASAAIVKMY